VGNNYQNKLKLNNRITKFEFIYNLKIKTTYKPIPKIQNKNNKSGKLFKNTNIKIFILKVSKTQKYKTCSAQMPQNFIKTNIKGNINPKVLSRNIKNNHYKM